MVSVESRFSYIERINESLKLKAFHYFLLDKELSSLASNNISDADEQFFKILFSIQTNNKIKFEEIYAKKSKSNPTKDSPAPFVNDDYLIFCLIVAIIKFGIDKTWIKSIISIRNRNTTTITFENILNESYTSNSNQAEVILVFLYLYKKSLINNDLLNLAYKSITESTTLIESGNDFHILCAFRAYDFIIYQKEASEGSEITLLKIFNQKFKSRIITLSWILRTIIFYFLVYSFIKLSNISPAMVEVLNQKEYVFNLVGALGLTFFSDLIPFLKNKSIELLMRLFGYPRELIQAKNKK